MKIVKEINGVLCQRPEQEFYHLMHISPHFCLSPFPSSTPSLTPFSEITLSFQLVMVRRAGCVRVQNFITVPLCLLTTHTHNPEGHAKPFIIHIQFPPAPQYNYLFLPDSKKKYTWLNFQFTGIHMWNHAIILRKCFDDLMSSISWIFQTLCAVLLSQRGDKIC